MLMATGITAPALEDMMDVKLTITNTLDDNFWGFSDLLDDLGPATDDEIRAAILELIHEDNWSVVDPDDGAIWTVSIDGDTLEWQTRAEAAESALDELKSGVYVTEQQMKIAVYDAYVRLFERWNEDSGGYSWAEWLEQRQGESHLATVLENAIDDLFPGVLDIVMAEARTWDKEEVER